LINDYVLAFVLGIIEGVTEFLPISSTAHLRLAEVWLGVDLGNGYWKMFSIVIQLGAILCLPIYFRRRIAEFVRTFPYVNGRRDPLDHPLTLTLIAFLVTAIPAFLLTKIIGKHLESVWIMAGALVIGGAVMWFVDTLYANGTLPHRVDDVRQMHWVQAVWIGGCQVLSAVFPGTSRSMATIAAGQLVAMSRSAALEFSFFLSIPTMVAATGYDLFKSLRIHHGTNAIGTNTPIDVHGFVLLAIGFIVSFVVAYGVVAWFMNWVRQRGFVPFAIYRILLGVGVFVWAVNLNH
jgi:undecaprenyl-diphosphatase